MAAAPIAWGAGKAINDQYNQDMASPKDGEWGTYAKLGIGDPVVVGAQDVVIGLAVGSALAGAGRLMGKLIKRKYVSTGARNISVDQYLKEEIEAKKIYKSIRKSTSDVSSIAKNTGMPESRVQRIKDHVFNNVGLFTRQKSKPCKVMGVRIERYSQESLTT